MAAQPSTSESKLSGAEVDSDVAPAYVVTQLLKDLLEAIKAEQFEAALIYCKKVLRYEPNNTLAGQYLTICKKHVDGDSGSDDSSSSDGKSADSDDEDTSEDSDDAAQTHAGARESKRPAAGGRALHQAPVKHK